MMSEGKLPNFAKLRQNGAYGRLISSRPILSPIIWTTIATGVPPGVHNIGHFVARNEKTGEDIPVTSQMRRAKALWNIFSERDRSIATVGWWATWPAESVNGTIVSDHTCYHFLFDEGQEQHADTVGVVFPQQRTEEILSMVRRPADLRYDEVRLFADVTESEFARPFAFDDGIGHFKWALATAESYTDIGLHLWKSDQPDLLMVYIEGVDSSSHLFGHLFRQESLKGELAEQQQRFGKTVERMYELADRIVGRYLELVDDETTLTVLSDHGFQLGALHDDPSQTRDMRRVSERYHRIEGILYLYGRGVKNYARINQPRLLDITPTLLALNGLPVATDMPGRVLTEALLEETEYTTVASYNDGTPNTADETAVAPVDPAIVEHLRSLGYLDTTSQSADRNLAAIAFEEGRYEDAVREFNRLLETTSGKNRGALFASLAGALGALERYDEALQALNEAKALSPLNPEIYHNRGVIHERKGDTKSAVSAYREALRYSPEYEPSTQALVRLTGSALRPAQSADPDEGKALTLAGQAAASAQRGDYERADTLLAEAEALAPDYAVVYQYKSNVAYLKNDLAEALGALERAVELEPDNMLFKQNLEYLRSRVPNKETTP